MNQLLTHSLDLLFPRACVVCERPLSGSVVCTTCRPWWYTPLPASATLCRSCFSPFSTDERSETLCLTCIEVPLPFRSMRFAWQYDHISRNFIRAIKYKPSRLLAHYSGTCLGEALPQLFASCDWDIIVPMPSSRASLRKRGFHHCLLMADALRSAYSWANTPLLLPTLQFKCERPAQATLPHDKRIENLKGAMVCTDTTVRGKRVLLVDDVLTTGATSVTSAITLLSAGALLVDVVALARAPRWNEFRRLVHAIGSSTNVG